VFTVSMASQLHHFVGTCRPKTLAPDPTLEACGGTRKAGVAVSADDATVAFRLANNASTRLSEAGPAQSRGGGETGGGANSFRHRRARPTGWNAENHLLKIAAGLLKPDSGAVENSRAPLAGFNREAGYLFQGRMRCFHGKPRSKTSRSALEVRASPARRATRTGRKGWLTSLGSEVLRRTRTCCPEGNASA